MIFSAENEFSVCILCMYRQNHILCMHALHRIWFCCIQRIHTENTFSTENSILLHTVNSYREHHSLQRISTENLYREFIQRIAFYSRLQIQTRTHTDASHTDADDSLCVCTQTILCVSVRRRFIVCLNESSASVCDDSFILQPSFYSEFIQRTSFYSEFIQRKSCYSRLHIQTRTHTASVIQPIADRVALNLEIISKKIPTNQNSDHAIYD